MKVNSKAWYLEGEEAWYRGVTPNQCPYDIGTEPFDRWQKGWYDTEINATDGLQEDILGREDSRGLQ
jgi:hypothetical protein